MADTYLCMYSLKRKIKMKNLVMVVVINVLMSLLQLWGQEGKTELKNLANISTSKKHTEKAQRHLKEANIDSADNFQEFKDNAELSIFEFQKTIDELKTQKWTNDRVTIERYYNRVMSLEIRNNNLKKKMEDSLHIKTSKWSAFKRNFNQDMHDLEFAIRNIDNDEKI